MTRDEVLRIVREAQGRGERPNLRGADLNGADLTRADLTGANLSEANLRWADLTRADLSGANLRGADLRWANLNGANLIWADLCGANLNGANLIWADLCGADLSVADLRGANLNGANRVRASGGVLAIDGLPSGSVRLTPTPGGWALRVGCWGDGTATYGTSALRDLIAGTDWPEAEGDGQDQRRPGLAAVADLCDAHAAANPDLIADLAKRWGTDKAVSA